MLPRCQKNSCQTNLTKVNAAMMLNVKTESLTFWLYFYFISSSFPYFSFNMKDGATLLRFASSCQSAEQIEENQMQHYLP